jgi:hypothetical protein
MLLLGGDSLELIDMSLFLDFFHIDGRGKLHRERDS